MTPEYARLPGLPDLPATIRSGGLLGSIDNNTRRLARPQPQSAGTGRGGTAYAAATASSRIQPTATSARPSDTHMPARRDVASVNTGTRGTADTGTTAVSLILRAARDGIRPSASSTGGVARSSAARRRRAAHRPGLSDTRKTSDARSCLVINI